MNRRTFGKAVLAGLAALASGKPAAEAKAVDAENSGYVEGSFEDRIAMSNIPAGTYTFGPNWAVVDTFGASYSLTTANSGSVPRVINIEWGVVNAYTLEGIEKIVENTIDNADAI